MELNKDVFFNGINAVIISSQGADKISCQSALRCFLSQNPALEQSICFCLKDNETTYEQLCNIAKVLIVIYRNTDEDDDEARYELCHLILGCYARAYILASMEEKHRIAYSLCLFIDLTYYSHYSSSMHTYFYGSHIEGFFSYLDINCDSECEQIYRINVYKTDKGLACYQGQRIAKLIQWYILRQIKKDCNIVQKNPSEIQRKINECYSHLCNINEMELSKLAYGYLKSLIEDYTDEGMEWMDANDEYWKRRIFVYNKDNKVEFHDTEEEIRREVQEEYDAYLQSQMYDHSNNDTEEYDGYGKYSGSYAQDEMGYSDDDIDTIFDGDPSAYWNID